MRFFYNFLFMLILPLSTLAGDFGSKDEARELAERAVRYINEEGVEKAIRKINNQTAGLLDRDLYVFIIDKDGTFVAHGTKPALIGADGLRIKDATGKYFVHNIMNIKTAGWVEYWWQNPVTKKAHPKETYVIKIPDNLFIGVGAYKSIIPTQTSIFPMIAR